ncbi:hypothetical protein MFIFM68171_08632 [Madurella fahalii]|uniref:Ig-like domain-containing protein n=1 Tax=Madurella fahalii TaxID=1157608 RepID=A0ABQ0GKZ7_9PEZI
MAVALAASFALLSSTSLSFLAAAAPRSVAPGTSFRVKLSWTCSDRSEPVNFTATGSNSVLLRCDGEVCKSSNPVDLIKGSLETPVSITPAYADGPDGHDKPGCEAASQTPKWTVGTIIHINDTGDGTSAIPLQSIQLQVTNEANGHMAECVMFFPAGPGEEAPVIPHCDEESIDPTRPNRYNIQTEVLFLPRSREVSIYQTWYCDDVDAAKPVSFSGKGRATLPLVCTVDGTTTSCEADGVQATVEITWSAPLAPYSIEDPLPTPDGCTISSVVSPSWIFSNFEIEHNTSASGPPSPPILFEGVSTTKLPELSCEVSRFGSTICATNKYEGWVAEVANVTWQSLDELPV